jgi:alpha-1,2-mannosyltransferase
MNGLVSGIASGVWLTPARLRAYSLILLALGVLALGALLATSKGLNDYQGRPLGTDFSNVYAAGKYVLDRKPAAPFDPALQHKKEQEIFGEKTPFYGWHYPPVFLFLAAALALLPYLAALAIWQASTLALYLISIRATLPRNETWLPALAFPAVLINIAHGHNGFLTAALIGGGLWLLDRKPVAAGILLGLLIYKPQFGVLIPLALAAGGYWRAFIAAGVTVLALCAATYFAFGPGVWEAFRESMTFTREIVLEKGDTGFHKIQSVFAAVRLLGGPVALAYAAQAIVFAVVAISLVWLWRGNKAFALKAAALIAGSMLATPYLLDYDLMIAAPAIAFLAALGLTKGFAPYEKSALAFVWIAPLLTRTLAEQTYLPLGLLAIILLFGIVMRRAAQDAAGSRHIVTTNSA